MRGNQTLVAWAIKKWSAALFTAPQRHFYLKRLKKTEYLRRFYGNSWKNSHSTSRFLNKRKSQVGTFSQNLSDTKSSQSTVTVSIFSKYFKRLCPKIFSVFLNISKIISEKLHLVKRLFKSFDSITVLMLFMHIIIQCMIKKGFITKMSCNVHTKYLIEYTDYDKTNWKRLRKKCPNHMKHFINPAKRNNILKMKHASSLNT